MVAGNYVLALSSVMDTQEGFERLANALLEIDGDLEPEQPVPLDVSVYREQEKVLEIHEAENLEAQAIGLEEAVGKISAGYLYLYPPGIPLIVPGERITEKLIGDLRMVQSMHLDLEGLVDDKLINIVCK